MDINEFKELVKEDVMLEFDFKKLTDVKTVGAVLATGVAVSAILSLAYQYYRAHYTKVGKKCSGYRGVTKQKCEAKARLEALNKSISKLKSLKNKCKKTKDPKKCRSKVDEKIDKLEATSKKLKTKIRELKD